jgi:hypothetical protein
MGLQLSHGRQENGGEKGNLCVPGSINVLRQRIAARSLHFCVCSVQCGTAQQSGQGTSRLCLCESCFLVLLS